MFCLFMARKSNIHLFFSLCSVTLETNWFIYLKVPILLEIVFSLKIQRSLQPVLNVYIDSSEEKNKQIAAIKYGVF